MTVTIPTNSSRNASLQDLADLLKRQDAMKVDVVAPATAISSRNGLIHVKGAEAQITEDGVTAVDGVYRPTTVFDEGIAEKLNVPLKYVRRMRLERPDLYDANVNGLLHGRKRISNGEQEILYPADPRTFTFRGFRGQDGEPGIARALLSDRYGFNDNSDVVFATLDGVRASGIDALVDRCSLTDRKMYLRIKAPGVTAMAEELLKNYRSPFNGRTGNECPVVFAGIVASNSETGCGAFTLAPQIIIEVCDNGLTLTKDIMRDVHIGGRMDEGVVRWSADTSAKNLALITAKTRDAVTQFLNPEYIRANVAELERKSGVEIADPAATVKQIGKKLLFSEEQMAGVLSFFCKSGQATAGGMLQAVTAYAQTIEDADVAYKLESKGVEVMYLAAA